MASVAGHPTVGLPGPNALVANNLVSSQPSSIFRVLPLFPNYRRRSEHAVSHHRSGPSTAHRRIVQQMCLHLER